MLLYPREIDSFMYYTCTDCRYDFNGLQKLSRSKSDVPQCIAASRSKQFEQLHGKHRVQLAKAVWKLKSKCATKSLRTIVLWNDLPTTSKSAKLNLVFQSLPLKG